MKVSTFVVFAAVVCAVVLADDPSGTCGQDEKSCKWKVDSSKSLLTISGNGYMNNFLDSSPAPWDAHGSLYENVVIEDGVKSIGNYAFFGDGNSNLVSLTVKGNIESLGSSLFSLRCTNFTTLSFEGSLNPYALSSNPFSNLKGYVQKINIASIEYIPSSCFSSFSSLTSLTIGGINGTIGYSAFGSCTSLKELTIDGINVTIGQQAFSYLAVAKLVIPSCVYEIDSFAFSYSKIEELTIQPGVKIIDSSAFRFSNILKKVAIPGTVEIIGSNAFASCSKLETVFFSGIHNPGDSSVFSYCSRLSRVIVGPEYEDFIFCGLDTKIASSTLASAPSNHAAHFIVFVVMAICVLLSQW